MDKILLIDGYSILNRAFYGLPALTNSKGEYTNAVLGFINIVMKVIEEEQPSHIAVAFDVHQPTFRHEMFGEYKGTRKKMPEELQSQVPRMKELLRAMDIAVIEAPGYEADDIIGTLSVKGEAAGMEVTVLSGDRDLLQLATEHVLIKIPKTKAGKTTVENYHANEVMELYGVTPKEFIDMKGLMGDASDNIPGVPGIGEKTAGKIIATYHSIEEAHAHLSEIRPKKAMENLEAFYEQALMSKVLATIKLDVPLSVSIADMTKKTLFTEEAYKFVKELELKSLLKYFEVPEKKVQFETKLITDLVEMENRFAALSKCTKLGIYPLVEENSLLGVGITTEEGRVDFFACGLFITEELLVQRFDGLFQNEALCVVTQDLKALQKVIPAVSKTSVFDVALAAYLLNPLKDSYAYDDIARDYLSMTVPSRKELIGKKSLSILMLEEITDYIAYETCIPYMAYETLTKELSEQGMKELYDNVELPTVSVLQHMEHEGIRVDGAALKEYGLMLDKRIHELEMVIYAEAQTQFNINSPKQLGEILFGQMGLPGGKKTKTGYSTSADVLNKLKKDHPIVENILDYRQVSKLKSTYADGLSTFIRSDGRIHGTFNQTITATGRISSTEPNLQNIPMRTELGRSIRKVFIPKEGCLFVDADYSQIELRVLAHFSGDSRLIDAYHKEEDIHALTASQVFHVSPDKVDDLMRRQAKAVNFGIVYGISAFGLAEDLDIPQKQAKEYIESYFETYPDVKHFLDETVAQAKKTGVTHTLFGRIRPVPELSSSNFMQRSFGERVAMNAPIQGTAADIIKIAMIRVQERLKKEQCASSLILQIHDELLIETKEDEVELVKKILTEEMMQAAELKVPLSVGVSVGKTWYDAK